MINDSFSTQLYQRFNLKIPSLLRTFSVRKKPCIHTPCLLTPSPSFLPLLLFCGILGIKMLEIEFRLTCYGSVRGILCLVILVLTCFMVCNKQDFWARWWLFYQSSPESSSGSGFAMVNWHLSINAWCSKTDKHSKKRIFIGYYSNHYVNAPLPWFILVYFI